MEDLTDEGLGEEQLAELLQKLERAVRSLCPAWLADRKDDLVQLATMKVMEISRKGEKSQELSSSYLWRAAHSVMIDEIRKSRRRNEVGLEDEETGEPRFVSERADPHRLAESRDLGREMRDCVGRLVRPRKLAVTLHLQGFSPAEAGPLLGWPTKKVYNLVHRGLQNLRDCLQEKGIEP